MPRSSVASVTGIPSRKIFGERVLFGALDIVEKQIANEADLDRELADPHEKKRLRIGDQVRPVADAIGAEQEQGVTHVMVGLVDFAAVDGERDARIEAAHLAKGFQKAQWVAFVVVLAADEVDARPRDRGGDRRKQSSCSTSSSASGAKAHDVRSETER